MDPVFCYTARAKGSCIAGLWVALAVSLFCKKTEEARLAYIVGLVFHALSGYAHGSAFSQEAEGYFVDSKMHAIYVIIHTLAVCVYGALLCGIPNEAPVKDTTVKKTK
uniref:Uncharacterized protein n=2 Tax=Lotharella oceanica TaxID=641309 RepID=A0A7S2XG20_9EUKA|mmetsp:Transcript_32367/g.60203  ORF Transcript_32367/g.60203 Transcript_32367/m.60203 type:complete len:108 (+) Transcript_32367:44-367(+)